MTLLPPQHRPAFRRRSLALGLLPLAALATRPAGAQLPPEQLAVLRHGINITNWFRFPYRQDPDWLRGYMPDSTMAGLRAAGFTFVRLCIQPQLLLRPGGRLDPTLLGVVLDAVRRLQRAGLAVIVDAHPELWNTEEKPADRDGLLAFWRGMAAALRPFDRRITFAEIMNEPVFRDPANWARLQEQVLGVIRASLPETTVIATGVDWGSVDGLEKLAPLRDRRILYSVHTYEPQILTTQAAFEQGLDRDALKRLPFPVRDVAACKATVADASNARTRDLGEWYCSERWDAAKLRAHLARAAAWGRQHDAPVAVLEWGISVATNRPARLAYIAAFREAAEQLGLGWAIWGYGDIMGFPAQAGARTAALDPEVLAALGLRAPR